METCLINRYELKFVITREKREQLQKAMDEHISRDPNDGGDGYLIGNIYMDTQDSDVIRHSLSKPYYKEKLRLRSYGVPASPDAPVFLEIKKKIAQNGNKRRAILTLDEAYQFLQRRTVPRPQDYESRQAMREISYYLEKNPVAPATYIGYRRFAYFDRENKGVRITFDCDIRTRTNDLRLESGNYGKPLIADRCLLEVKAQGAIPLWLAQLLSRQGMYHMGFSKYGREYEDRCLKNGDSNIRQFSRYLIAARRDGCINY